MLKSPTPKCQQAFTLIEIMVSLFLFVLVVGIVSASLMHVLSNTNGLKEKQRRLIDVQAALATIEFDLRQVIDAPQQQGDQIRGSFYTQNNHLHFQKMGNLNPEFSKPISSLEIVEYQLEEGKLMRLSKDVSQMPFRKQILLDKVQSLSWQFYDPNIKTYSVWPPTFDWSFKTPICVTMAVDLSDLGMLELMVETSTNELFIFEN